jgi:hypothetical protein
MAIDFDPLFSMSVFLARKSKSGGLSKHVEAREPLACVESDSGRVRGRGEEFKTRGGVKVCLTVLGRDSLSNAGDTGDGNADGSASL